MTQKVSLGLSGGGARGIAHIGVIEVLEENGYEICSIAGTSMGSLVGAIYALGKMEEFKEWLFTLDKLKVFGLVDFTLSGNGLVKGDKILHKLQEIVTDTNIEDLSIPYKAVATDIVNKKEIVFSEGSIFEAVRASIAIPTVFTPIKRDDSLLVDGGVVDNLPLGHVKRIKDDLLVAVNVNADIPLNKPKKTKKETAHRESVYQNKLQEFYSHLQKLNPFEKEEKFGLFDLLNNTISLMIDQNAQISIQKYPPDIMIDISRESCSTFDFFKAEELVEIGRHAAELKLKQQKSA